MKSYSTKFQNQLLVCLLMSLVTSMVFLKFDVGTNIQKFTEISDQTFLAPTTTVNLQVLTLHTRPYSGSTAISVQTSQPGTKASDCNFATLLCLSVAPQTINGKRSLLIKTTAAYREGQKQKFTSFYSDSKITVSHEIVFKIQGSWAELYVDAELLAQYRYGVPLGISTTSARLITRAFGENSQGLQGNEFRFSTRQEYLPSIILFVLSLLGLMVFLMYYMVGLVTKKRVTENGEVFSQILILSSAITAASWIVSQFNLVRNKSIFPTSGLTFLKEARFSDFFQVWGFSGFKNLYQVQVPDYPPLQISIFSIMSRIFLSESVFLVIVCCSTAALGALVWSNFMNNLRYRILLTALLTFTSAPLILAVDRGSTDLILFPLISLAVLLHSNGRIKTAATLVGIVTALKILPGVYLLMFVGREKSLKKVLSIIASVVMLNVMAAAHLSEKNVSELWLFVKALVGRGSGSSVSDNYDIYNNSLWTSFRGLSRALTYFGVDGSSFLKTTWLVTVTFLLIFSAYWCLFRSKQDASKLFIANCLLLLLPAIAPNYRLLFMYPSLWYLSTTIIFPSDKLKRTFMICSAFLFSISPVYYFGSTGINIGQVVKPFLVLTLLMIVCFSDGYHRDKFSSLDKHEDAVNR